MRILFENIAIGLLAISMLVGCTDYDVAGPIDVKVILPSGNGNCTYEVGVARLETITSLRHVQGRIGNVVWSPTQFTNADDYLNPQLKNIRIHFGESGGVYYPLDYPSLVAISMYYYLERAFLMFQSLGIDMEQFILQARQEAALETGNNLPIQSNPDWHSEMAIIYDAILLDQDSGEQEFDNAFFAYVAGNSFFFTNPTVDLTSGVEYALNMGVLGHEYTHFVVRHLVQEVLREQLQIPFGQSLVYTNLASKNAFGSFNEGISDYFGYYLTGDPGFIGCSNPDLNRNLSELVALNADMGSSNYSIYSGGTVFARANYAIGQQLGSQQQVASSLTQLLQNMPSCLRNAGGNSGGRLSMQFKTVLDCHVQILGTNSSPYQGLGLGH